MKKIFLMLCTQVNVECGCRCGSLQRLGESKLALCCSERTVHSNMQRQKKQESKLASDASMTSSSGFNAQMISSL